MICAIHRHIHGNFASVISFLLKSLADRSESIINQILACMPPFEDPCFTPLVIINYENQRFKTYLCVSITGE